MPLKLSKSERQWLLPQIAPWLESDSIAITQIAGGRNNRVFRAVAGERDLCIKWFYRDAHSEWNRLRHEVSFSRWCEACNASAPRLMASSEDAQLAAFQWIEGERLKPDQVNADRVAQLVQFLRDVNPPSRVEAALEDAAEACFSFADHQRGIADRLQRFERLDGADPVDAAARDLVFRDLAPLFDRYCAGLPADDALLSTAARIASPSDFGFHNALVDERSALVFCDFEYAGWDDPAKTICDALCQVQTPIPDEYRDQFVAGVCSLSPDPAATRRRAELLLPLYEIKWCCILLNEFHADDGTRREFSGADSLDLNRQLQLATQLAHQVRSRLESMDIDE